MNRVLSISMAAPFLAILLFAALETWVDLQARRIQAEIVQTSGGGSPR